MTTRRQFTSLQRNAIAAEQEWRCNICRELLPAMFPIDHIIPLHLYGTNDRSNLNALCYRCHGAKTQQELLNMAAKSQLYEVKTIHRQRMGQRGQVEYEVEWEGYPHKRQRTWQLASDLENCSVFHEFLRGPRPHKKRRSATD